MANILESALHEAVHDRNLDALKSVSVAQVKAYLRELWDTVADFDILMEAGDAMGRAGIAEVEAWFCEWLSQQPPDDEMVLDMAGAFLMGYWPHVKRVDNTIVERLLAGFEVRGLGRNARDSLICALAGAHRNLEDHALRDRIARSFATIWARRGEENFQPVVEASLTQVLGQGGDA